MKLKDIRNVVEHYLDIDLSDDNRIQRNVFGRAIYFQLCREYSNKTLAEIGESLGKHHATVIHATNNVFPHTQSLKSEYLDLYKNFRKVKCFKDDINKSELMLELIDCKRTIGSLENGESKFNALLNRVPEENKPLFYERVSVMVRMFESIKESI